MSHAGRGGEALAASEPRLRALLEAAVDAIVSIDERGIVQLVNLAAERLFGYAAEELIGQNVSLLMPSPYREEHDRYLAHYQATGEKKVIGIGREVVGRRKDGTTFPLDLSVAEARLGDWRVFVGIIRDITERKRTEETLRQSEARLRDQSRIVEHAQIHVRDLNDRIILWNLGAERLYGWSRAEALGQVSHTLLQTTFPAPLESLRGQLEHEGEWEGELTHRHKDGTPVTVIGHWVLHRDESGVPQAILEVSTDISQQKRAEEALRQSKDELERLVAELRAKGDEVRAATQQLWQAAKLATVGELAASIAHELNNPLATVSLRVESVLARTPVDDPRRRGLEVIAQETKRMGVLVSSLLQFARRGEEKISTVDVREELTKAVDLTQHHLRKRQVTVVQELTPATPTIYADRQKLRQVFLNLLTNAGDAMAQGGTLTLRSAPIVLENGQPAVQIEFVDTGVGIPAEQVQKVFDPFFTTKKEGEGTGLGLAICRRAVEDHRGTIQILSELGKGTTVRIVLPVTNGTNVLSVRGRRPAE